MNERNTPMEAEVSEMLQPSAAENGYYGTSVPVTTKKSHTAVWVCLCLVGVMLASAVAVCCMLTVRDRGQEPSAQENIPAAAAQMPDIQRIYQDDEQPAVTVSVRPERRESLPNLWKKEDSRTPAGNSVQELYDAVTPCVVCVQAVAYIGNTYSSGIILSEDGYILAGDEFLKDATSLSVIFYDGSTAAVEKIGTDAETGLAVLKTSKTGLAAAEFSEDSSCRVGDRVISVENPFGAKMRNTLAQGIISGISDTRESGSGTFYKTTIEFTGSGIGCPVIDSEGKIIGVVCNCSDMPAQGLVLDSATVRQTVDAVLQDGGTSELWLGFTVQEITKQVASYYRLPGTLMISDLEEGTYAAKWMRSGDVILSVNDVSVSTEAELRAQLNKSKLGETVTVIFYRFPQTYSVELPLISGD